MTFLPTAQKNPACPNGYNASHMFKKRKRELTTADAPDNIEPWVMLNEDDAASATASLAQRYPTLTAFARRSDTGAIACFDKGPDDGPAKGVIVINQEHTKRTRYESFSDWFDAVLKVATEFNDAR